MNTAIILILGIPLIEIYLFIKVGSEIGALNTILLILTTAVVGIWYARYEGFNTLRSGMSQLVKNELPLYEIVSGAAIAFAALLLILPGFATDIAPTAFVVTVDKLSTVAVAPEVPPVIFSPVVNEVFDVMFKCVNILISNR